MKPLYLPRKSGEKDTYSLENLYLPTIVVIGKDDQMVALTLDEAKSLSEELQELLELERYNTNLTPRGEVGYDK